MHCSREGFLERGSSAPGGGGLFCQHKKKRDKCLLLINCLITPILLVFQSVRIYFIPCVESILFQCCCALGLRLCGKYWRHSDRKFPANAQSLGDYEAKSSSNDSTVWKRAFDIVAKSPHKSTSFCSSSSPQLFGGAINTKDICQGQLGDCWLLSAIACLAEREGAIQRIFREASYNSRGKYTLLLFDCFSEKGVKKRISISIDDRFPCSKDNGVPIFSNPGENGHIWVCILEKAFAKMAGNYASLEGGHSLWALEAMTGEEVLKYSLDEEDNSWKSYSLEHCGRSVHECKFVHSGTSFDSNRMFQQLLKHANNNCVLGASSIGKDTSRTGDNTDTNKQTTSGGIVPGHAYSILYVRELGGFKLLCLRNPWGSFEWKGDWSDSSPLWRRHPLMRKQLTDGGLFTKQSDKDDGIFWMSWSDFLRYFHSIDVCMISQGIQTLTLNTHEEHGFFGPVIGCCFGCFAYWVFCCGLYKLWCARPNSIMQDNEEESSNKCHGNEISPVEMTRIDLI